ncbi:2285_t:CDS:10 [Ambispora gerdemannii]|uniref:Transcriptional adapter 2 n=1 Tax=Ambispora gerdemannii TaxID=144530 RepID=A0A9N9BKV6_9GLOM|nr:2285_t:CDS:10 [Ambispora gerdemannii]
MYRCKNCQAMIGNTVRINCAECPQFDLCVTCFCAGKEVEDHKNFHKYRVMDQFTFPIFTPDWCADEEELLIEGAQTHGLGNWGDIAAYVGSRTKEECERHYLDVYLNAKNFIPSMEKKFENVDERDMRERKRRRMESIQQLPPIKAKTHAKSLPANHEIQGYMPKRKEFETEIDNDAEQLIKELEFDNDMPKGEVELKLSMLKIYNKKLDRRTEKKRLIFEHGLVDFKKKALPFEKNEKKSVTSAATVASTVAAVSTSLMTVTAIGDKVLQDKERQFHSKLKVFAKLMNKSDHEKFVDGMLNEFRIRDEILKLQEWRRHGITTIKEGEKYQLNKLQEQEATRDPPTRIIIGASSDRLAAQYAARIPPVRIDKHHANNSNNNINPNNLRQMRKQSSPIDLDNAEGVHMLTSAERTLCSHLRIFPKPYMVIKEIILKEYARRDFRLKRREARELIKIDVNKTSRIYDFFVEMGWIHSQTKMPKMPLVRNTSAVNRNGAIAVPSGNTGGSVTTNGFVVGGSGGDLA